LPTNVNIPPGRFADMTTATLSTTFHAHAFNDLSLAVASPSLAVSKRVRAGRLLYLVPERFWRLLNSRCYVANPDPNLELHSAAANGNVGLVHYALTHGQPVNSLLHGCVPLHAASSGGNVTVVRMLIERGADVNAPRLPRRYSDKGKTSNMPSVGTTGEYQWQQLSRNPNREAEN